jgi:hypothetical protein
VAGTTGSAVALPVGSWLPLAVGTGSGTTLLRAYYYFSHYFSTPITYR